MRISDRSLDRIAMMAFALLLAVCSVAVIGFIVFAQFGVAAALLAAAAMTLVVSAVVLALNQVAGF